MSCSMFCQNVIIFGEPIDILKQGTAGLPSGLEATEEGQDLGRIFIS